MLAGGGHDHGFCRAAQQARDVLPKVPDDDVDLLGDVVLVQLHPTVRCFAGSLLVDRLDVVVGSLQPELVGHLVLGVVLEDVEDEAFLDGLAHRVAVERFG